MIRKFNLLFILFFISFFSCSKTETNNDPPTNYQEYGISTEMYKSKEFKETIALWKDYVESKKTSLETKELELEKKSNQEILAIAKEVENSEKPEQVIKNANLLPEKNDKLLVELKEKKDELLKKFPEYKSKEKQGELNQYLKNEILKNK